MEAVICTTRSQVENDESLYALQQSPEVIMALDVCDDGTMGCAFFDSMDGSLQLAEDVHRSTVDVSEHFATLACPTLLLVSSRAPQEFLDHVQRSKEN